MGLKKYSKWIWSDEEIMENWRAGSTVGNETCAGIGLDGLWKTLNCDDKYGYICQIDGVCKHQD